MKRALTYSLSQADRRGFTLPEILVVMVLILTLATLAVALVPRFGQTQKLRSGADMLQRWLAVARSRSFRDQMPTGIRLIPNGSGYVTTCQYVQTPDALTVQPGVTSASPAVRRLSIIPNPLSQNQLNLAVLESPDGTVPPPYSDFTDGQSDPRLFAVQPGDYLEINGGGLVKQISQVTSPTQLQLLYPLASPVTNVTQYRIIRRPRLLSGEQPLNLPDSICIDLSTNATYAFPLQQDSLLPAANADGSYDILFLPGGGLTNVAGSGAMVALWCRDLSLDGGALAGAPEIICIQKRTGMIAAHPVDTSNPNNDPYAFARDGRSSGL
jgi:prepilin-type N-terminal cleavage/methylation domain-containing protein